MEIVQDALQKQTLVSGNGSSVSPNGIVLGWFDDCYRHYAYWYTENKYWNTSVTQLNKTGNVRTYVALKCVHVTVVVGKSNKYYIFWVWVFSFRYPACKAHAPYCQLCPFRLYYIFPHYLINSTTFGGGGKLLNIKLCFDFLYNFCLKHFSF